MKKHWKKITLIGGALVLVALLVICNLQRRGRAPEVRVQVVKRSHVEQLARADGTVEALNQVELGSDVMGKIVEIRFKQGERVKKGDTLCVIDPGVYREQVASASAALRAQEANLAKAQEDYERAQALFEKGLIAKSQLDAARATYQSLLAQVQAQRAQLNQARVTYSKTFITSPVDGEVVAVNKEVGEQVIAGTVNVPGSVIMVVADMSQAKVEADVDETEVVNVAPGQRVKIKIDAFPGASFGGVVTRRSGVPSENLSASQAVTYPVEILIDSPPRGLLPGMSASCDIITQRADSVLVVPLNAVGKVEGEDVVFLYRGGKAVKTPVKLGLVGETDAEIKEGVSEGDTVIVGPASALSVMKDGQRVKIKKRTRGQSGRKEEGKKPKLRLRVR